MSNIDPIDISEFGRGAGETRALKLWARSGGILFALATVLSMAYSAEWEFGMMVFDPLVWMMLLMALAAGLVCGYAVGVRLVERTARIRF